MKIRRILMSLCGVLVCAVSVGIFKLAALGVDPFQSLMSGLDKLIPIDFGTLYVIVNVSLFVDGKTFIQHKKGLISDCRYNIGIATFINLFLLGYITDYTYKFLQTKFPDLNIIFRIICLCIGIVIICFGSALYMTADLGVSTYDAVAIVISTSQTKVKFKYCRIATDLICVIAGTIVFLCGGGEPGQIPTIVGVGTIITAFFMGPLIEFFNETVARPILGKKKKQNSIK